MTDGRGALISRLCKASDTILWVVGDGLVANPFKRYYFYERSVRSGGKVYRYIEVYAQRPRGAHGSLFVARIRPDRDGDSLRGYLVESLLHDAFSYLLGLRRILEELRERGVCLEGEGAPLREDVH